MKVAKAQIIDEGTDFDLSFICTANDLAGTLLGPIPVVGGIVTGAIGFFIGLLNLALGIAGGWLHVSLDGC